LTIDDNTWNYLQNLLGYSDEEMKQFKENPRNIDVVPKMVAVANKTIIAEVVESHGCYIEHKVGDKLYFDGGGNLITKLCPKRVCSLALGPMIPLLFCVQELAYSGSNPNDMRFKRVGCPDVGIGCGGWGHVVFELRVEERK
jgi:uncharacterized repeat protein (TIGR04076 family)